VADDSNPFLLSLEVINTVTVQFTAVSHAGATVGKKQPAMSQGRAAVGKKEPIFNRGMLSPYNSPAA